MATFWRKTDGDDKDVDDDVDDDVYDDVDDDDNDGENAKVPLLQSMLTMVTKPIDLLHL